MDDRFEFIDLRSSIEQQSFAEHVKSGLTAQQKWLSPRFFYDERGSKLFERITELPEYYPYNAEREILTTYAENIVSSVNAEGVLIELGSGSSEKTEILLDELLQGGNHVHYVPVDISGDFLRTASERLIERYDGLEISAIAGTYELALKHLPDHTAPRLFLLLGGNIGNYDPEEARVLIEKISNQMDDRDRLMVGIDLLKDPEVIERAYNDSQGVTAAFNKNILRRINRELDGEFDPDTFRHHAPFVEKNHRVEMHLVSTRPQEVPVHDLEATFEFNEGESIHTENSYKYNTDTFQHIYDGTSLEVEAFLRDEQERFAEVILN